MKGSAVVDNHDHEAELIGEVDHGLVVSEGTVVARTQNGKFTAEDILQMEDSDVLNDILGEEDA